MYPFKTFLCVWIILFILTESKKAQDQKIQLKSRINTQQIYQSVNVKSEQLYYISVDRLQSSKQDEGARCTAESKYIDISNEREVFRLSKGENQNRNQKVYQKLTSLNEQENIIEQFEVIGNKIFLITTQGDGYYVDIDNSNSVHKVKTNFFEDHKGPFIDMIVIKDYKQRALIIGKNKIVLCKLENDFCDTVDGYQKSQTFRGAQLFEDDGKYFIFIVQGQGIITYELTANGKVKDKKEFGAAFFGTNQISLRAIYRVQNKILVLDDLYGIREITTEGGLGNFNKSKIVYEQYGCYQIVGQDKGDSLALACAPSLNNYFILKIAKSRQFAQAIYEPLQTVFLHQKLYQVDYVQNILLSRVFSGVKLFWSSKMIGYPYPHFYRQAGDIFLHNAIQAKLKIFNTKKTIVLAAQDELLIYQLNTVNPYVSCSSKAEVSESYKLTYYFPCREQAFMHQENICDYEEQLKFQAWEHKELKMNSHILPLIFLLLGVVGVVYLLIKLQKKYSTDVELARLKYNVQGNQLDY